MRDTFLPFSPPFLGEEEVNEVVDTLRSDWITTGPKTRRFEQEFARCVGAPAALAVTSCTHAMLVALAALGIGPGDEVITTPMTFCSTVHSIEHMGARPVLVDVEPDTLCIDPAKVAAAVTPRTRAIMPVHLYGHPCAMDEIFAIARRHGLHVLEDSAHGLAAKYKDRPIGSHTRVTGCDEATAPYALTAFSFYATKNITTAEGGMLTGDPEIIEKARVWSLHGMSRDAFKRYSAAGSWYYEVVCPGFKCNMTDIQAAMGLQQLKKLSRFQERRHQIVRRYQEAFSQCDAIETPVERAEVESSWHLYVIRLNLECLTIDRARFIEELKQRNIGASVHFIPVHIQPYYRDKYGYQPEDFPVAYAAYQHLVTLPLNPRMTEEDTEDVIEAVTDIVMKFRR